MDDDSLKGEIKNDLKEAKRNPLLAVGVILGAGGMLGMSLPHGIGFWAFWAGLAIVMLDTVSTR